jgi:hypothetical protein
MLGVGELVECFPDARRCERPAVDRLTALSMVLDRLTRCGWRERPTVMSPRRLLIVLDGR